MMGDENTIGYVDIPIQVTDLQEEGCFGYFQSHPDPQIAIHDQLSPLYTAATGLHEVLEAISAIYGLELTEGQVRTLETALVDIVKRNPRLCGEWLGMVAESEVASPT